MATSGDSRISQGVQAGVQGRSRGGASLVIHATT